MMAYFGARHYQRRLEGELVSEEDLEQEASDRLVEAACTLDGAALNLDLKKIWQADLTKRRVPRLVSRLPCLYSLGRFRS